MKNSEIREYHNILSIDFPKFLYDYLNQDELKRIDSINLSCGMNYLKAFDTKYFYSNLDHSLGVALIIWNFTHEKKQTLSGLFHDIATPCFKHCIDFMNGDHETQESTEDKTFEIINNSKGIRNLLLRDKIDILEVCDYKIYPICDNDMPKLSSDRFEYNFSSGLSFNRVWNLNDLEECYKDVDVLINEDGIIELGFKHIDICEKYISIVSKLWPSWTNTKDRVCMQYIADTCKQMNINGYLSIDDLYNLKEIDVVNKILNCEDKEISDNFKKFMELKDAYDYKMDGKYTRYIKSKQRYVNPLVDTINGSKRIYDVSEKAKNDMDNFFKIPYYGDCSLDIDDIKIKRKKM